MRKVGREREHFSLYWPLVPVKCEAGIGGPGWANTLQSPWIREHGAESCRRCRALPDYGKRTFPHCSRVPHNLASACSPFMLHFILPFYNSVKLLSSMLKYKDLEGEEIGCIQRWGRVMDRVKSPHHLKISVKSTMETAVLYMSGFRGCRGHGSQSAQCDAGTRQVEQ